MPHFLCSPQTLGIPCSDLPFSPKLLHPKFMTTSRSSKTGSWAPNRGRSMAVRCEGMDHGFYMRLCVELARTAVGCTSPNPMVGCVIVRDGEIVGEGFHPKAGQPHAEVFALKNAGVLAENATAYLPKEWRGSENQELMLL